MIALDIFLRLLVPVLCAVLAYRIGHGVGRRAERGAICSFFRATTIALRNGEPGPMPGKLERRSAEALRSLLEDDGDRAWLHARFPHSKG